MSYITSVEQIGYDRGLEQGKRSLLLQILIYTFSELPSAVSDRINKLSIRKIEALSKALLDFRTIEDLTNWLETHSS